MFQNVTLTEKDSIGIHCYYFMLLPFLNRGSHDLFLCLINTGDVGNVLAEERAGTSTPTSVFGAPVQKVARRRVQDQTTTGRKRHAAFAQQAQSSTAVRVLCCLWSCPQSQQQGCSRHKNDTAPAPELFFSMAPVSLRFHTLIFSIILVWLKLNGT